MALETDPRPVYHPPNVEQMTTEWDAVTGTHSPSERPR
ncbi:hypothetical protein FTUN_2677 [Frigoriglobus tundricola]|uniref:Uncharacterized protein n=1 Tax=Frigoriglobus tundricola TaxID=2774151 RepID=A0A6M5YMI6_9BACT|nr:hypothetical protein FTUN_2677 [Frigoriglobus tundricola]